MTDSLFFKQLLAKIPVTSNRALIKNNLQAVQPQLRLPEIILTFAQRYASLKLQKEGCN